MRDFSGDIAVLARRIAEAEAYLNLDLLHKQVAESEAELSRPDLWDDPDHARQVTTSYARARDDLDLLQTLRSKLSDCEALHELAVEESDDSVEAEIEEAVADLGRRLDSLELRALFTGEYDEADAVCEINSGEGGTDAQDWAEMLLRMYLRWAERRGFEVEVDSVIPGQEAGIQSATFIVKGRFAYGLLTAERGVHRLVRMSPFDSAHRRHTGFAALDVTPFVEDDDQGPEIDEKDLRIDTYRSSGAGGQHVNVTDSAVRITHIPTGIVVSCQNERSQFQNKARAMQILSAKLAELSRQQRKAELEGLSGPKAEIAWGSQIRSYVLAPYRLVKDHRTGHEDGNVEAVLDGDLDEFVDAYLRWRREHKAGGKEPA
jgi:peptide chain release factor 2